MAPREAPRPSSRKNTSRCELWHIIVRWGCFVRWKGRLHTKAWLISVSSNVSNTTRNGTGSVIMKMIWIKYLTQLVPGRRRHWASRLLFKGKNILEKKTLLWIMENTDRWLVRRPHSLEQQVIFHVPLLTTHRMTHGCFATLGKSPGFQWHAAQIQENPPRVSNGAYPDDVCLSCCSFVVLFTAGQQSKWSFCLTSTKSKAYIRSMNHDRNTSETTFVQISILQYQVSQPSGCFSCLLMQHPPLGATVGHMRNFWHGVFYTKGMHHIREYSFFVLFFQFEGVPAIFMRTWLYRWKIIGGTENIRKRMENI